MTDYNEVAKALHTTVDYIVEGLKQSSNGQAGTYHITIAEHSADPNKEDNVIVHRYEGTLAGLIDGTWHLDDLEEYDV